MRGSGALIALLTTVTIGAVGAGAAPTVNQGGILNAASFALPGLPSSGIARGSLFTIFGTEMGPTPFQQAGAFPIPFNLGGTEVTVLAGGQEFQCPVVVASATQVSAILPSSTPIGQAQLLLRFNGEASAPVTFEVVESSLGVFARNQQGSGAGIVQNFESPTSMPVNFVNQAANPGQLLILWGTGLGPITESDAGPPPVANLPVDVQVKVGGRDAVIQYQGRSGCCAGIDQVNFLVPEGVAGCAVPVTVVVGGVPSNFTTISVAESGKTCSDPSSGITAEILSRLPQSGELRFGTVNLQRVRIDAPGIGTTSADNAGALFSTIDAGLFFGEGRGEATGTCLVTTFRLDEQQGVVLNILDAGPQLSLVGPGGNLGLLKNQTGMYSLSATTTPFPVPIPGFVDDLFLSPGGYTISGPGGADVGAFSAMTEMPPQIEWTNKGAITEISRAAGVTVRWADTGSADFVTIAGSSFDAVAEVAGGFSCRVPASAGQFTVPPEVTLAIPTSVNLPEAPDTPLGGLTLGAHDDPTVFEASGLDWAVITSASFDGKSMNYR